MGDEKKNKEPNPATDADAMADSLDLIYESHGGPGKPHETPRQIVDRLRAEVAALKAERAAADGCAAKWEAVRRTLAYIQRRAGGADPASLLGEIRRTADDALSALGTAPAPAATLAGVAVARFTLTGDEANALDGCVQSYIRNGGVPAYRMEFFERVRKAMIGAVAGIEVTLAEGPGEAGAAEIVHACNESAAIDLIAAVTETSEETVREAVGRIGLPQIATNAENVARKTRAERDRLAADLAAAVKARDAAREEVASLRKDWTGAQDDRDAEKARADKAEAAHAAFVLHAADESQKCMAAFAAERTAHEQTRAALARAESDLARVSAERRERCAELGALREGVEAAIGAPRRAMDCDLIRLAKDMRAALAAATKRAEAAEADPRRALRWGGEHVRVDGTPADLWVAFRDEVTARRMLASDSRVIDLGPAQPAKPEPDEPDPAVVPLKLPEPAWSIRPWPAIPERVRLIFDGASHLLAYQHPGRQRYTVESAVREAAALLDAALAAAQETTK